MNLTLDQETLEYCLNNYGIDYDQFMYEYQAFKCHSDILENAYRDMEADK